VIAVGRTLDAGARCVSGQCPDCQAALGLSARRRSADLQRTDRPWQQRWVLDDLAGCDTDVHERANFDVHERANFGPRGALEQVLLPRLERRDNVAEPPGVALEAVVAEGGSPVRERLFNAG
jgi:hypothetical protein